MMSLLVVIQNVVKERECSQISSYGGIIMEKELTDKLDKLSIELEQVGQMWEDLDDKFETTIVEVADTLKNVIEIRTNALIKEFEDRLVDMFCIAPETCKIEGDFVCSECKRHDVVIARIKDKFSGANKRC